MSLVLCHGDFELAFAAQAQRGRALPANARTDAAARSRLGALSQALYAAALAITPDLRLCLLAPKIDEKKEKRFLFFQIEPRAADILIWTAVERAMSHLPPSPGVKLVGDADFQQLPTPAGDGPTQIELHVSSSRARVRHAASALAQFWSAPSSVDTIVV